MGLCFLYSRLLILVFLYAALNISCSDHSTNYYDYDKEIYLDTLICLDTLSRYSDSINVS
jgi:hypothetical protein